MNENDVLIRTKDMDWVPAFPGAWVKPLRSCSVTGQWTQLLKLEAGASLPSHFHLGAGEFIVLEGELHYASGVARPGDYGYEAVGAYHAETYAPVETVLFFVGHGALAMLDENGKICGAMGADNVTGFIAPPRAKSAA